MGQVTVYQCDGPDCLRSDDESMEDASLMLAGWSVLSFVDEDEVERVSHFCSFACVEKWAAELAE